MRLLALTIGQSSGSATYQPTGGNPGGHICCEISSFSDFFAAPAPYLGNKANFIGGTLSLEVQHNQGDVIADFILVLEGSGTVLVYDSPIVVGGPSFTQIVIPMQPAPGWSVVANDCLELQALDCDPATESDFHLVMSNLSSLNIRGDWISGADIGRLDNVNLVPEPGTLLLVSLGIALSVYTNSRLGSRRQACTRPEKETSRAVAGRSAISVNRKQSATR